MCLIPPQTIVVRNGTGNTLTSGVSDGPTGGNPGSNSIDTDGGNNLDFENDPTTTLVIQKFVEGTENQPMKGVEFLVTDSSGAVVGPNNGYYYTDKDGRITISNLEPGTTVTARETKTLAGFVLDGTPQSIKIKVGEAQTMTFWNKKAGGLVITKLDAVSKEPLAGVRFKLTYADGTNVDQDGGKVSTNGIYVTDSNGQINVQGVTGTIIATEIETIPGYIIDPNTKSQTVKVNADDTQYLTFYNTPTQTLVIQKLVEGSKDQGLAGVEFLVTDSSGAFVGPNNGIYKTDQYGRITISDLKPGSVITAKETKALDGYVLDSTPQSIEIKSGSVQTLTFYNTPVGGLELIKVSESDKSQRIKGVTFVSWRPRPAMSWTRNTRPFTSSRARPLKSPGRTCPLRASSRSISSPPSTTRSPAHPPVLPSRALCTRSARPAAAKWWTISPRTSGAWPPPSPCPWAGIRSSK